ncbi:MAG: methyltransferase domain-containing protein [bacterium]
MDSDKIKESFCSAARTYDRHSSIQQAVAERLIEFMPADREFKSILEIGCGTGIYTDMLVEKYSTARICCIDIAPEMVNRARQHFKNEDIEWLVGDAREILLDEKVSLVTGSSTVHWVQPLDELFGNINRQLYNHGQLVVNVMLQGTLKELHNLRRHIAPDKFETPVLPGRRQVLTRLEESGFEVLKSRQEEIVQQYASARDFLTSLSEQGVTPCSTGSKVHFNRGELEKLSELYEENHSTEDGVKASYNVLELRAEKNG